MLQEAQEASKNWRKHWFVVNVLVEIPVVGSFFKKKTLPSSIHAAGKCIAAMAGGTTAMMSILVPTETDDMTIHITKMTTSMIIGMTTGKVIYNGVYNSGAILYQYLRSKPSCSYRVVNDDSEMQPITADLDHNNTVVTGHTARHQLC